MCVCIQMRTYVCACVVYLCVCVYVCACEYLCAHAHVKGLKTPFLLVSFLLKRGPASSCLSSLEALRGGLGGFPGLSSFMRKLMYYNNASFARPL